MAEIRVYPSMIRELGGQPVEPLEIHQAEGTLHSWLLAQVPAYADATYHPLCVEVGGREVPPQGWPGLALDPGVVVCIYPLPQRAVGRALSSIVSAVVSVVSSVFSFLTPRMPDAPSGGGERGASIYSPGAQANQAKLGEPVPELAGQHPVYPDYLSPPRRYFAGPKTMGLDLMLCVTAGECELTTSDIRVGQTPLTALSGVDATIFGPGESVTGHPAHQHWYTAHEVGATRGNAGLHLRSERDLDQAWDSQLVFNGSTITGASLPDGWGSNTEIDVSIPLDVEVVDGSPYQTFRGNFDWLGLEVGAEFYLRFPGSDNTTRHRVVTFEAGIGGDPDEITVEAEGSLSPWVPINGAPVGNTTLEFQRRSTGGGPAPFRIIDVDGGEATVELRVDGSAYPGWQGWTDEITTSDARVRLSSTISGGIWSNVYLGCPPGRTTERIEVDVFAPQGLGRVDDDGNVESRSRTIEIRYRPEGSSSWTTLTETISAATRDQLGWTWAYDLPSPIRPEVQMRRVESEDNDTRSLDRLEWYGLKARLPAATSYPGATTVAMSITGSNELASQSENQISCLPTRILPRMDGSTGPTRSIADWMRHVTHSVGYSDEELDLDELDRLEGIWAGRGDAFDYVHAEPETVKRVLDRCLRAGFAETTIVDGLLSAVRDEPRGEIDAWQMYSPQNYVNGLSRAARAVEPGEPDGIDVEYFDADTWAWETVECRLPGDQGFRAEQMRVEGVTSRTRAWRIGMRQRRRERYVRWAYQFSTEMDALNSDYLSPALLGSDVPGYAQSALMDEAVQQGSELHVIASEPLEWQAGESHVLLWRRPDGTSAGPYPAAPGDDEHHVIVTIGSDPAPEIDRRRELPHILFGADLPFKSLVRRIRPRGLYSVTVEAENYDERIYEDDDNAP